MVAAACSGGAEHALIGQFFAASRLRDLTALERLATVRLEPRDQGTVLDFSILEVKTLSPDSEVVTVDAHMRLPGGELVQRQIVLGLSRRDGRWIVSELTVSQGSRATPPS